MKKIMHALLLRFFSLMTCLIFLTACGGGEGGGSSTPAPAVTGVPVLESVTISPNTVTIGRSVSFQISFIFLDTLADLDNGTLYLSYGGTNYSASLPSDLAGRTAGDTPTPVSIAIPLNSTVGTINVRIWLRDRAGNESNVVTVALSQMSFGSQVWGSSGQDRMTGTAIDGSGNIYVVGYTSGNLGGESNRGGTDGFISKFDVSGNRVWINLIGEAGNDAARSVAVDSSGNVYVVGEMNFVEGSSGNAFLAKYNSLGLIQWSGPVSISASVLATARGVTLDSSGNIYVAGYAKGDLNGQPTAGSEDPFLMKFNSSGIPQWTQLWGDVSHDYGNGVAVDGSGNIYVVGNMASGGPFISQFDVLGNMQWTSFVVGTTEAYAADVDGSGNIYVVGSTASPDGSLVKFDPSGHQLWLSLVSSPDCDHIRGVAVDNSGHIYVTGWTAGDLVPGDNLVGGDAFLAKFEPSGGAPQWTNTWGTNSDDLAVALAVDSGGDIHVAGDTMGSLDGYTNSGGYDLYLIKFNSAGLRQ